MASIAMESGHRGKPFYCRDWAFEKLKACLNKRPTSATCGTLVMGDSGCGKTAFCTELVWPSRDKPTQVSIVLFTSVDLLSESTAKPDLLDYYFAVLV